MNQSKQKIYMRKLMPVLAVVFLLAGGCKKDGCPENNDVAPAAEEQMVAAYLTANNITATKHKSNMYYQVITPGTGGTPSQCSTVQVAYVGKLTTGAIFDQSTNYVYSLQGLIPGWMQGIPLIQKGGSIRLFIPPSLGYGNVDVIDPVTKNVDIPANSVLVFDINLVNYQ
jgi:FKBP-type peptidyl-prolyl cis-trans isomerase FkpA